MTGMLKLVARLLAAALCVSTVIALVVVFGSIAVFRLAEELGTTPGVLARVALLALVTVALMRLGGGHHNGGHR